MDVVEQIRKDNGITILDGHEFGDTSSDKKMLDDYLESVKRKNFTKKSC